jgi:prepilin-type processing-associated H-X9-DG protein
MTESSSGVHRRGFTIKDLAVTLTCLLIAAGMLASLAGATRDLSQTQVCAANLRQMYAGMAAYVEQYNSYPPNAPYPTYMANETINGIVTGGWDPNIGFIMTHGLGLVPPRTDTATGHFIWYGTSYADLPDVCKCPAMSPALLDPTNPEVDASYPLETVLYHYALSYMTSGTCRAATPLIRSQSGANRGLGGRNPLIPNPTGGNITGQPYDNAQRGVPFVYVGQHQGEPDNPNWGGGEFACWIQAVHPAEVQSPGRTFYLSDSRDYRPIPGSYPAAGRNSGWGAGYGQKVFLSTRHFQYANVLYLDGHVTRDGQTHHPTWNMVYTGDPNDVRSGEWRAGTFSTDLRFALINTQVPLMPVLMVKGWEYFFSASGVKAQ